MSKDQAQLKVQLKVQYVILTASGWNGYCSPNSKYWRELFLPLPPPQTQCSRGLPDTCYSRGSQPFLLRGPPPSPVNFARPPWHFLLYCTSAAERKVFIFKLFLLTKTFVLPYYSSTACHKKTTTQNSNKL